MTLRLTSFLAVLLAASLDAADANFTLTWSDNSANEAGFRIERSDDGVGYAPISAVAANVTNYVDTTATAGRIQWYRVSAFNAAGSSDYSNIVRGAMSPGPAISSLGNVTVAPGAGVESLVLFVDGASPSASEPIVISGSSSNPELLPDTNLAFGGSGSTRTITLNPRANHTGTATVTVTVRVGTSAVSTSFVLTVGGQPVSNPAGRLLNVSVRATSRGGGDVLIPGFSVVGPGAKRLLLRAVGPTLGESPFNLAGVLPDPRMVLQRWDGARFLEYAANNNWGDGNQAGAIRALAAQLFAFGMRDGSLDAALLVDLPSGLYTVVTDDATSAAGGALFEIYDADTQASDAGLRNLSNRGFVGTGGDVMILGFVISPEGPKQLLLRTVGPALAAAPFNLSGTLDDPVMDVYRKNHDGSDVLILTNDDWNNDADVTAVGLHVSAFPLPAGSKDAAVVATLPPGIYTVLARGANGLTGQALVEAYVVE